MKIYIKEVFFLSSTCIRFDKSKLVQTLCHANFKLKHKKSFKKISNLVLLDLLRILQGNMHVALKMLF